MNAAASKEGSIIDIDTGPTLNTVSGERGKENWEVVWGHMAARVQFGVPLDHFMLTVVVRNLKLTWTQQLDAFEIAWSRQWHEKDTHREVTKFSWRWILRLWSSGPSCSLEEPDADGEGSTFIRSLGAYKPRYTHHISEHRKFSDDMRPYHCPLDTGVAADSAADETFSLRRSTIHGQLISWHL